MRKLKILGLIIGAIMAISAVGASAAQAAPEFHCTNVTGTSCFAHGESTDHVFTLENGSTVKCTTSTFESTTTTTTTTTVTFNPVYKTCKAYGVASTVDVNGCGYLVHLTPGGASPFPTTTDVECETGKAIEVTATGLGECTIKVEGAPHNQGLTGLTAKTTGTAPLRTIEAKIDITNQIHYTEVGKNCPNPGTHTKGSYTGTLTLKGFKDESGKRGAQLDLFVV